MRYTKSYERRFTPLNGKGELLHYLGTKGMSPAVAEVFILREKGRDPNTIASTLGVQKQHVINMSCTARKVVRDHQNTKEAITVSRCRDCCYRHGCLTYEGEPTSILATVCLWFAEEGRK